MSKIFSFIFDKITDPLTLPIEPWKEWIIISVIGLIAYIFSFAIVGNMYDSGEISGSLAGSICHWAIRLLIFVPVWFVVYWVIVIGQWIIAHLFLALVIAVAVIILAVAIYFTSFHIKKIRKIDRSISTRIDKSEK